MIVTIEEARETMCVILTAPVLLEEGIKLCRGPRCMAWRSVEPTKGFCGMVPVWPEFKRKE